MGLLEFVLQARGQPPGSVIKAPPALAVMPFVADRAGFMKTECHFDPSEWLPVGEAAAMLEPRLIERRDDVTCDLKPMKQDGLLSEIVKLAKDLDAKGKLVLAAPGEIDMRRACKLIPVYRDEKRDRVVWDRRIQNCYETPLRSASQRLVGGCALVDYELDANSVPLVWAEDVSDFYPAFDTSEAKAMTNLLGRWVPAHMLSDTAAFKRRRRHLAEHSKLAICVKSLLMGDLNAIDVAQGAHESLLQAVGSLDDARRLHHGRPAPLSREWELLQIDDHVGIGQRVRGSRASCPVLQRSFADARDQYARVGLRAADDKRVEGQAGGVVLGTELMSSGWCGAERLRRMALALASTGLGAQGVTTGAMLRRMIAGWEPCLGYRRPLMCVLHAAYRALPALDQDDVVFQLSPSAREELCLLSVLAPLMTSNLRASMSDQLVASDASGSALASVRAQVPVPVVREVWRHRNRRGYYTKLSTACAEYARSKKLLEDRAWLQDLDEELQPTTASPPWQLLEVYDFVELCTGEAAPLSRAHMIRGMRVGPRIDIRLHPLWDVRSLRLIE